VSANDSLPHSSVAACRLLYDNIINCIACFDYVLITGVQLKTAVRDIYPSFSIFFALLYGVENLGLKQ